MAGRRLKVGILFGGRSAEHEVSVVSAQAVMAALDADRFQAVPIGVTRQGTWLTTADSERALTSIRLEKFAALEEPLGEGILHRTKALGALRRLNAVFPLIHGTNGEDGTLQGFLELAGAPYVGSGVAASALGMDKALQKVIFRQHGFPMPEDVVVLASRWRDDPAAVSREVEAAIPYPSFVKPANSGSSIGTSKARSREDLDEALEEAFRYDRKALVEISARARLGGTDAGAAAGGHREGRGGGGGLHPARGGCQPRRTAGCEVEHLPGPRVGALACEPLLTLSPIHI